MKAPDADGRLTAWCPLPGPQAAFVDCPVFECFFGGARGGGKTEAVIGEWAIHAAQYGADAIGLMIRRTRVELDETFERAKSIYTKLGVHGTYNPRRFIFPNGARITYAYLERDTDAEAYQGWSTTRVYIEEAGNFPSPAPILKLMATLRSGAGVPVGMRLTGNPGGSGHQWLRARYIDPAPLGWRVLRDTAGLERIYIPSRVADNAYLGSDYVQRLQASGSPELVRAWLFGDWSVVSGAFFPEFSAVRHIMAPRSLPEHWARFRSFDWGSARPFACHWWAVSDGSIPDIARGCLVCYREWYGMKPNEPNVGLRMTAEQVAEGIRDRERDDPKPANGMMVGVADPAIFAEDGGPSIAARMTQAARVIFRPADNKRVPQRGAMGGWDQLRSRLVGDADGKPMVVFFATARDLIRTLPTQQHDTNRAEDIDTDGEDHAVDSCFVAGTMIETARGPIPIERVTLADHVMTRSGYQAVTAAFSAGERPVLSVRLSNGSTLTGTDDHPVFIEGRGFIPFRLMRYGDMMRPCQSSSLVKPFKNSWASRITNAASTFSAAVNVCIALCGSTTTAAFRGVRTSITETWIQITTNPTTWFALPLTSTCPSTASYGPEKAPSGWRNTPGHRRLSGMGRTLDSHGIVSNGNEFVRTRCISGKIAVAINAARLTTLPGESVTASVPMRAGQNGVVAPRSMMSSESALDAVIHFAPTNTVSRNSVATHALSRALTNGLSRRIGATIAALRSRLRTRGPSGAVTVVGEPTTAGRHKVYNLSVALAEEYFANGVLVHNCRYAMMSRPYVRDAERQKPRDSWDAAFNRDAEELRDWRVT